MLLLRWLRYLVGVPVLMLLSGVAAGGPTLWVLLVLDAQQYRVAGTVVALALTAWWVFGPSATRSALVRLSVADPALADDRVARAVAAQVSTSGGGRPPTVWTGPPGLPEPVTLQGVRSAFVLVPPGLDDASQVAAAVREDRATGAGRLAPLALVPPSLLAAWGHVVALATAAVRPGTMPVRERLLGIALLPLAPLGLVGWLQAWVVVQVARVLMPRRVTQAMLALAPRQAAAPVPDQVTFAHHHGRLSRAVALGDLRRRTRPGRTVAGRLSGSVRQDWPGGLVLAATGALPLVLGTYIGAGTFVGERVAWPWEEVPVTGEVVALDSDLKESGGLLGRLGVDIASERRPTVRTAQGELEAQPMGTQQVAVGDRITVVPGGYHGGTARWAATSLAQAVTVSGFWVGLATVVRLALGGLLEPVVRRHVRILDHDQRGTLGLPRRRRRPKPLLGIDLG